MNLFVDRDNPLFSPDVQVDIVGMGLTLVLPWSLSEDLQDDMSEPRVKMEEIFKDKVRENNL